MRLLGICKCNCCEVPAAVELLALRREKHSIPNSIPRIGMLKYQARILLARPRDWYQMSSWVVTNALIDRDSLSYDPAIIGVIMSKLAVNLCAVCDYHVHAECQEGALPNCRHASSHTPGRTLDDLRPAHYWREGNLPTGAKCLVCRKSCWSGECLAGWKCEWCGLAVRQITPPSFLLFLSLFFLFFSFLFFSFSFFHSSCCFHWLPFQSWKVASVR